MTFDPTEYSYSYEVVSEGSSVVMILTAFFKLDLAHSVALSDLI